MFKLFLVIEFIDNVSERKKLKNVSRKDLISLPLPVYTYFGK